MAGGSGGRSLEETPTWGVALVCFVLLLVSIFIEHIIHLIGKWLKKKHKKALYESLEKIKSELMLLGFISLLLTVGQGPISMICVSEKLAATWHPCSHDYQQDQPPNSSDDQEEPEHETIDAHHRRLLAAGATDDYCASRGKVPLVSSEGIHQLHIFIFVLAVFHVLYCILTLALGRAKMRRWKGWEEETKTPEYQFSHDPDRFRLTRETSFGRRHLGVWTANPLLIWIICFFRQFVRSVPKVDYLTLRHGFMMAHLAPQSHQNFDFRQYIKRTLDEDFKVVVEIRFCALCVLFSLFLFCLGPAIWSITVLFLLFNTHGWYSYLWLPFVPLIITLVVGTKLQVIITKMGHRIQQRGVIVRGVPVVQPGDDLFWFNKPRLVLFLINFVLFQNAFQLAFFSWTAVQFGFKSCFYSKTEDVVIRITMGIFVQILCSYVTLPLYALVTQMGSRMKPAIFNERIAKALRKWHHTARENIRKNRGSVSATPMSSRPTTPNHPLSPTPLLRYYRSEMDSFPPSPIRSKHLYETDSPSPSSSHRYKKARVHAASSSSSPIHGYEMEMGHLGHDQHQQINDEPTSVVVALAPAQHEIDIVEHSKEFSFDRTIR